MNKQIINLYENVEKKTIIYYDLYTDEVMEVEKLKSWDTSNLARCAILVGVILAFGKNIVGEIIVSPRIFFILCFIGCCVGVYFQKVIFKITIENFVSQNKKIVCVSRDEIITNIDAIIKPFYFIVPILVLIFFFLSNLYFTSNNLYCVMLSITVSFGVGSLGEIILRTIHSKNLLITHWEKM